MLGADKLNFYIHCKVALREFAMELWPGYETSIRQHERDIMLCAEITHKVMRTETVYDILRRGTQNPSRHQEEFRLNVLGLIVLTDYNNKTYRINDVDFTQSPRATFSCKGRDVSFVEYYLTVSSSLEKAYEEYFNLYLYASRNITFALGITISLCSYPKIRIRHKMPMPMIWLFSFPNYAALQDSQIACDQIFSKKR